MRYPIVVTLYERFYRVVRRIPRGRVATYGQVAALAGLPRHARHVGFALAALADDSIPWHRVINAKGEISERGAPTNAADQKRHLQKEGVRFDSRGRLSLKRYGWSASERSNSPRSQGSK